MSNQTLIYDDRLIGPTIRIDSDVVAWLKEEGVGYQGRLNAILRREMLASKGSQPVKWRADDESF